MRDHVTITNLTGARGVGFVMFNGVVAKARDHIKVYSSSTRRPVNSERRCYVRTHDLKIALNSGNHDSRTTCQPHAV